MSRVVIVEKNKDGKIEVTKEELQKMLDDAYNQGYADGKCWTMPITRDMLTENPCMIPITYPSIPTWYTTTVPNKTISTDHVTLNVSGEE